MRTRNPNANRAARAQIGAVSSRKTGSRGVKLVRGDGTILRTETIHVGYLEIGDNEAQLVTEAGDIYTNAAGTALNIGDVVTIVGTTVTTTTTAQYTGPLGVVVAGGDDGDSVGVQSTGIVALIHTTGSVAAGDYLETSATAGYAQSSGTTRRTGSFAVALADGPDPSALLFGAPDSTESSSTGAFLTSSTGERAVYATTTASGSALSLDLGSANIFDITLTANCTLSFTNPPDSDVAGEWTIILRQDGTGSRTVTWPGSVSWQDTDGTSGGSAPTLYTAASAQDVIVITTLDGGTTYGGGREGNVNLATPAIVLGTAAAAGSATTVIRSDATIAAFDATAPVTQAFSDAAATGSAAYAARRDHVHGMPANPVTAAAVAALGAVGPLVISDTPSTPLVFADLIQNEAQDDLVYADLA